MDYMYRFLFSLVLASAQPVESPQHDTLRQHNLLASNDCYRDRNPLRTYRRGMNHDGTYCIERGLHLRDSLA